MSLPFYTDKLANELRIARPSFYDTMFELDWPPHAPWELRVQMLTEWARLELRDHLLVIGVLAERKLNDNPRGA